MGHTQKGGAAPSVTIVVFLFNALVFKLQSVAVKTRKTGEYPFRARVGFGPITLSLKGNWLELRADRFVAQTTEHNGKGSGKPKLPFLGVIIILAAIS